MRSVRRLLLLSFLAVSAGCQADDTGADVEAASDGSPATGQSAPSADAPVETATFPSAADAQARRFAVSALAAEQEGDFETAFGLHQEAAALCQGPDGPIAVGACPAIAQYQAGLSLHSRGRFADALEYYGRARAAVPGDFLDLRAALADRLGDIAMLQDRQQDACTHYGDAHALHLQAGRSKRYDSCPGLGTR